MINVLYKKNINKNYFKHIYYITGISIENWGEGICKKIKKHIELLEKGFPNSKIKYLALERKQNRFEKLIRTINPFDSSLNPKIFNQIESNSIVYMRYVPLDLPIIYALKKLKRKNVKIILEIPTYPFDGEKSNLLFKILSFQDKLYRILLKKYISSIVTYSDDKYIWGIKAINISNGVDINDDYEIKTVDSQTINMLAVASLAFWHGYDRVIQGLYNYYKNNGKRKIYFHIVGDGRFVLDDYKKLVKNLNLDDYVVFYGRKSGKELDEIYNKCNLGIDSLGRHRSNVTYNSSIKGKEYLLKGLPIISGVKTELDNKDECSIFYFRVPADDSPVNMNDVISFFDIVYKNDSLMVRNKIRNYAKANFDFSITFRPVIDYIKSLVVENL